MKKISKKLLSILLVLVFALQNFCFVSAAEQYSGKPPKYIFMFIGDGMAWPQVQLANNYLGVMKNGKDSVKPEKMLFTTFPHAGTSTTYDNQTYITESPSAGTALATGKKTNSNIIGLSPDGSERYETIAEKLKKQLGYKIGIVSTVNINNATPAAYYAHQPSRKNYYEIAMEIPKSNFDYFAGGEFLSLNGNNNDKKNIHDVLAESGYKLARTKKELLALKKGDQKVVAISPDRAWDNVMDYEIDRTTEQKELGLSFFTKKGIELLDNDKGFFMMVEGGSIDWSGHANDAATTVHEVIGLDSAVKEAYNFYKKHPTETLIIVTGDHETGGLTLGNTMTAYTTHYELLANQKMSFTSYDKRVAQFRESNATLETVMADIKTYFGLIKKDDPDAEKNPLLVLSDDEYAAVVYAYSQAMLKSDQRTTTVKDKMMYGVYEPLTIALTKILGNKAGVAFTSLSHTGLPTAVFAVGAGADLYDGYYDNTDIAKYLFEICKVK